MNTTRTNHREYQVSIFDISAEILRFIVEDAWKVLEEMPEGENADYYAAEIHYASKELHRREQIEIHRSSMGLSQRKIR